MGNPWWKLHDFSKRPKSWWWWCILTAVSNKLIATTKVIWTQTARRFGWKYMSWEINHSTLPPNGPFTSNSFFFTGKNYLQSCHYKKLSRRLLGNLDFNEVPRDKGNLFVISRLRYIKNLDLTKFWENKQNVRYIEVQLMINCLIVAQEPSKFWLQAHYRTPTL